MAARRHRATWSRWSARDRRARGRARRRHRRRGAGVRARPRASPTASGRACSRASTGPPAALVGAAQARPDHLARGRAARGRVRLPTLGRGGRELHRGPLADASCPRRPRSSARSPASSTRPGCRTCSSASSPSRSRPSTPPATRRPRGIAARGDPEHRPGHDAAPATPRSTARASSSRPATSSPTPTSSRAPSTIRVELPSGDARRDRRAVRPEARRRAALRPAGLHAPALRFATATRERGDGRRGARLRAAAGRSSSCPPASTGEYAAKGRDIYGRTLVTRDILELRAGVEPGRLGRAARPRGRHDRRARVRGVAHGRQRGLRDDADERRGPDRARDRPDRRGGRRRVPPLSA